jgi:uncharacterized tellurite resistance protein B-like protein
MGIFEKVMQEHNPAAHSLALTPRQAFAALVLGASNSDGRGTPEETLRINEIFNSTKLFRQPSAEPAQAVVERVLELFDAHGFGPVVAAAAKALPEELRAPVFTIAVDLVLADGQASGEEQKFIDGLQTLLQVPDEAALKIVEVILVKNSV